MEKPSRWRRCFCTGGSLMSRFLCALLLGCAGWMVFALEGDLYLSTPEVLPTETVSVVITVFPAKPSNTELVIEVIPPSFSNGSQHKVRTIADSQQWLLSSSVEATQFRLEWKAQEAGEFSVGPFMIRSEGETLVLPPVIITVIQPNSLQGKLWWQVPSEKPFEHGEPAEIQLYALVTGTLLSLDCPPSEGMILEASGEASLPVVCDGLIPILVASRLVTPLSDGTISLPAATVSVRYDDGSEGLVYSERLSVPVMARSGKQAVSTKTGDSKLLQKAFTPVTSEAAVTSVPPCPFVEIDTLVAQQACALWEEGQVGKALVLLRTEETIALVPFAARSARMSAEKALSISHTFSVPPLAWIAPLGLGSMLCLCVSLVFARWRVKPSAKRSRALIAMILCSVPGLLLSLLLFVLSFTTDAVVLGGTIRQVPEETSRQSQSVQEGTAIRLERKVGSWVLVRTADGRSGWMKIDEIGIYRGGRGL